MPGWKTFCMRQRHPHVLKKIHPNIKDVAGLLSSEDELLDVGCYHGYMYRELGHEKYTGMDLFQENVDEAKRLNPGVKFMQGDLFDLSGKWEVVLCSRVLMHVPKFEEAIEILRACCRKHLVVFIPIGKDELAVETVEGEQVYFRTFPIARVLATGGKVIEHAPYSTVIYGPNLP